MIEDERISYDRKLHNDRRPTHFILIGDTALGTDENTHNSGVTIPGTRMQRRISVLYKKTNENSIRRPYS